VGHDAGREGADHAAWLDIVARLELPSAVDPADPPWPDREGLAATGDPEADRGQGIGSAQPRADEEPDHVNEPDASGDRGTAGSSGPGPRTPANRGRVIKPARSVRAPSAADHGSAGSKQAAHGPGDLPDLRPPADALFPIWNFGPFTLPAGPPPLGGDDPEDGAAQPDPAWPDRDAADENAEANDRYVPPRVPPLPKLDPVARGAWTALFGGPGYLFVATMLQWQVPGWAELASIVAFIAGFVVLVSRLGDGPSRRDGPDQGAVV
jgi:hypothetical protein